MDCVPGFWRSVKKGHCFPGGEGRERVGTKINRLCNLSAVALWAGVGLATAHADPKGLWLAQDGAKVLVSPCGTALCGTLVSTEPPTDPATGRPRTDKNNPDQAR